MEKASPLFTSAYWQKNLPDFSHVLYKEKSEITKEYKKTAIVYKNVQIMALNGQEITQEEVKTQPFWEFDLYPHLESQLLNSKFDVIGGKATLFGGEAKLWKHLEDVTNEIAKNHNIYLDIYNLTPTEAIMLIKELIRTKLNYDDLIAGQVNEDKIKNNLVTTAKPEYLDYFTKDPKKYAKLAKRYSNKVGYMTADQIIKHQYVVCRHVAAVASILYEILRNNQQSVLMNGSYLIYHDEKSGKQFEKACIGSHAYNILYVTHPAKNDTNINISVIDTTYTMSSDDFNSNPDYTSSRLSQACSSLYEYGQLFDFETNNIKKIATLALKRTSEKINSGNAIFYYSEKRVETKYYLSDYLSLLYQTGSDKCLETLFKSYENDGLTRSDMVEDVLSLPPVTLRNIFNKTFIKAEWITELATQLEKIDFSKNTNQQKNIFKILTEIAHQITLEDLQSRKKDLYFQFLDVYHKTSKHF